MVLIFGDIDRETERQKQDTQMIKCPCEIETVKKKIRWS